LRFYSPNHLTLTRCREGPMRTMSTNREDPNVPHLGRFPLTTVTLGDCSELIKELPDNSIAVLVTSPPYWGQRLSAGTGVEDDPRDYLKSLVGIFASFLPKLKPEGLVWINIGDAYNTPVNWRL